METQPAESEGTSRRTRGVRVVGVGASAGGLKPLQEFVAAIPEDSGLAYVVILHLDPGRESRIAELLQDRTSLEVTQIAGPTPAEPNHIYVTPSDRDLEMGQGVIGVRGRSERAERVPIDVFFRTLADVAGPDAIGVVLSGTGQDGSEGVRAIREAGGITAAQSPREAEYPAMPSSAIDTGRVDLVLPAAEMPAELLRWASREESDGVSEGSRDIEAELAPIFSVLRARTGHDFRLYKRSTVLRRLDRRLLFNGVETLSEYVALLRSSDEEADALMRDLLISVSAFFRDEAEFDALAAVIPALFEGRDAKGTVRVWVVGCATGEEVYSIAMLLAEHAATLEDPPRIQMFATDIDEKGYAWGREGLYSTAAVAQVTPERLERFFVKEPGGYRISKALRESVLFAVHDVLRDAPFARIDLISCRNLFIYLQTEAQQQVLETFHYALNDRGVLFLGASETAGDRRLFSAAGGGSDRLYRRNPTPQRVLPRLSAADPRPRDARRVAAHSDPIQSGGAEPAERAAFSYGAHHVHMVEQYAEPSLIVDEQWNVVHLSEAAGTFLRQAEGEPARHILHLTHEELRTAMRTALHQAFDSGLPTVRQVRMPVNGTDQVVRVHVRPGSENGGSGIRFALIVFEEAGTPAVAPQGPRPPSEREDVRDLEAELQRTRDQLESTSAAYDRTVAELQTVNEELLSINEEQKAAAEELETGREEIQAINEELTTINQEHQSTIEELKRTNADLQNLIESTEIGTIFVDRALRIRRFTPAVTRLFNFAPSDHGRPLGDITHRLDYPDLLEDVHGVLESLERREREVASGEDESFIVRINPYRSADGEIDGAVLTFLDHSAQHRAEVALKLAITAAQAANEAKSTFLSTLSHELRTPLAAIMGYSEILQLDGRLNEEQDHRVERIKAAGRHLVSMIDGLLGFVRLDGGREVVEAEPVDARTLASDAHGLLYPLAHEKGLTFELEMPSHDVVMVTDVPKARQILANLGGNAVKYTSTGGVRLLLSEDADDVLFEVIDTGIGIASEHQERVFERFWQVDGRASRASGGLGIGLAAARASARLLGGDVELESEVGQGSTFRLRLPSRRGTGSDAWPALNRRVPGRDRREADGDDAADPLAGAAASPGGRQRAAVARGKANSAEREAPPRQGDAGAGLQPPRQAADGVVSVSP